MLKGLVENMRIIKNDTGINFINLSEKYKCLDLNNTLFFDIETTGFSAKNTKLYMIGVLYADNTTGTFHSIQWFLDDFKDEAALICEFVSFTKDYKYLIHYNGQGFDIPYIETKCKGYNKLFDFSQFTHIDLYKYAARIKNIFQTENLKQKTMENFFNLNREDIFSGGDLISVYYDFMEKKDERAVEFLLLHNYEDLKGMITLVDILAYDNIFNEKYTLSTFAVESYTSPTNISKKEAIIGLTLNTPVPKRVSFGYQEYYMTAFNNKLKLKIQVYTDELKFFYPNYKDYYYLPEEDMSIHKSVAFYVDKNYRTRAKAANCYSKKTGQFLPQHSEIITPYFKKEYNDKKTYFEVTDEFMGDTELIYRYVKHVLDWLMKV